MRRHLHIVLTVNAAWNVWNFRRPLVQALLDDGHRITILSPHDHTVPLLEQMGCRFRELDMDNKGLNPLGGPALWLEFRRHLRVLAPDLVLSFTIKPNLFGALAAKGQGIPFIPNVTGLGTAFLGSKALQLIAETLYRLAFRRLPIIFFQNKDDRDLFLERGLARNAQARLLPGSGIDLDLYQAAPYPQSDPVQFLMIARLIRDKGVFEYVEAAQLVAKQGCAARFALLGPIDSENRTSISRDQLDRWIAGGAVDYLGTADDVRPIITGAHCVVLPSYREGAPRTLIEGAALARPAIASDVSGCNSVVEHGKTGLLCEARNAQSLAECMIAFCGMSAQQQEEMGQAALQKMAAEFGVDRVVSAYRDAILQSV